MQEQEYEAWRLYIADSINMLPQGMHMDRTYSSVYKASNETAQQGTSGQRPQTADEVIEQLEAAGGIHESA